MDAVSGSIVDAASTAADQTDKQTQVNAATILIAD